MSDDSGFNIIVDDPKALFLMQQVLGYQETMQMLTQGFGGAKIQLNRRLRELYPSIDFSEESGWIVDLLNTRLRKLSLTKEAPAK